MNDQNDFRSPEKAPDEVERGLLKRFLDFQVQGLFSRRKQRLQMEKNAEYANPALEKELLIGPKRENRQLSCSEALRSSLVF